MYRQTALPVILPFGITVKALAIALFVFILVMLLTGGAIGAGEIVLAAVLAVLSGVVYSKRAAAAR